MVNLAVLRFDYGFLVDDIFHQQGHEPFDLFRRGMVSSGRERDFILDSCKFRMLYGRALCCVEVDIVLKML